MNLKFTKKKGLISGILLVLFTFLGSYFLTRISCSEFNIQQGLCSVSDFFFYSNSFLFFALPGSLILYILMSFFQKSKTAGLNKNYKSIKKKSKIKSKNKKRKTKK